MKKGKDRRKISTFQGADVSIEGNIEFEGSIRLDGNFKGKIASPDGVVVIGPDACVDARIDVDAAVIMGTVRGEVRARKKVEMYPPASVTGDIRSPVVAMEPGVSFQGGFFMDATESNEDEPD